MSNDQPQGCLAVILGFFGIQIGGPATVAGELPFRQRDDFLSAAEFSFYRVLVNVVGDRVVICCKVNLADLFFVVRPGENQGYRNKIDRKHVDFLLCDAATMKPRCGVELDDSSHGRRDRQDRDAFVDQVFAAAGLPLVRVPAQAAYNLAGLRTLVEPHLHAPPVAESSPSFATVAGIPNCPKCGVPMVERVGKKGHHAGQKFLGCPHYPRCKEIMAIGVSSE